MVNLYEWAQRWGIPMDAIADLRRGLGIDPALTPADETGFTETAVLQRVRLEGARLRIHLWRNNVGACYTDDGSFIRYGLMNDSAKLNRECKSSDLIGLRSVLIQPQHVGQIFGQFVARECKPDGWKFSGDAHETAQLRFLQLVAAAGGDASFATGAGTL